MSEFRPAPLPETLQVIDDMGVEQEVPQEDFWLYGWDAQPSPITFEEYLEKYPIPEGGNDD